MYYHMIVVRFVGRLKSRRPGRRIIVRWPHEIVSEERRLVFTHELALDERRKRRQARAHLADVLPAIVEKLHREHVGRRSIHDASATDVQPVKKRADDTHKEQHALPGASLIDV